MALVRITKPSPLAVSIEDVRDHLLMNGESDESLDKKIQTALNAAIDFVADKASLAVAVATYELRLPCWPYGRVIELPIAPVREVESVEYTDAQGVEQTIAPTGYTVEITQRSARIIFHNDLSLPSLGDDLLDRVIITFSAGFDEHQTESDDREIWRMPSSLRSAILMKAESDFEAGSMDSKAKADIDAAVESLIFKCRVMRY
jgi:uncharacterized phiE125 gp8 family phage protein